MSRQRRLGVIGTFVWAVVHGRDARRAPVEEWGGIAYALSGLDAALPPEWEIVPVLKVGSDLAPRARDFFRTLRRLAPDAAAVEVPWPNDRIELRYTPEGRRSDVLSGGVPGWSWIGLRPLLANLDALYINAISGAELDLETAQLLRQHFRGPVYCDLHALAHVVQSQAAQSAAPLASVAAWCRCFDFVQMNEDEMSLLAPDPMALAATALDAGVRCLTITLGPRGAVYFAPPDFEQLADVGRTRPLNAMLGPIRTALVPAEAVAGGATGDPTGCGDVWGATYFSRLLAGDKFADAMRAAHRAAARNVEHRGATGLAHHLRGELSRS